MSISDTSSLLTASSNEDLKQISNEKIAKDSSEEETSEDESYNKMNLKKKNEREY